jgi:hypothetical protein
MSGLAFAAGCKTVTREWPTWEPQEAAVTFVAGLLA